MNLSSCSCDKASDPNCAYHADLAEELGINADRLMRDPEWLDANLYDVIAGIGVPNAYRDFIDQDDLSFVARIRAELQKKARAETEVEMRRAA